MDGISISIVCISAFLFHLSYAVAPIFYWCAFLFLVPIFCLPRLRFSYGLVWGLLFYAAHFYAVAYLIYEQGQGDYRLLVYLLLVLFCALHSASWLYIMGILEHGTSCAAVRPLITFGFFVWMQTTLFWPFDLWEGYPFALPIIPLAHQVYCIYALPWIGVYGLTACLIAGQWTLVQALRTRSLIYIVATVLWYAPFFIGYVMPYQDEIVPSYTSNIICVAPVQHMKNIKNPLDGAQEIAYALQDTVEQCHEPDSCFIMPESAYPFCMQEYQCSLWQSLFYHNEQQFIIGTHKKCNNKAINVLVQLNQCRIIQTYEKTHSTPLTERIPYYLRNYGLFNLFGGETDRSHNKKIGQEDIRNLFTILIRINHHYFLPVLCSELFFNDFSSLPFKKVPMLLLCNDGWFYHDYPRYCMFLYAKIYAITWQRSLLYISHTRGFFISQTGNAAALRRAGRQS